MITYILAANSELNSDTHDKQVSMSDEEILQRLGDGTTNDVLLFSRFWKVRFHDCTCEGFDDGQPVFYDQEDFDNSWQEVLSYL
jgi:hypothetical protein